MEQFLSGKTGWLDRLGSSGKETRGWRRGEGGGDADLPCVEQGRAPFSWQTGVIRPQQLVPGQSIFEPERGQKGGSPGSGINY
jgi:hypothetical protein